jgi:hypothetical protein
VKGRWVAWLVFALGCAQAGADLEVLEARHPALAAVEGHRLADLRPYYLPADGLLTLFTCRWPDGAAIPVEIPADASPTERRHIEAALAAWEGAGLGVRFERRPLEGVGIGIALRDGLPGQGASTIVDCAVDASSLAPDADPLAARVVSAEVRLARGDPALAGKALHELGHALGFQGHAAALRGANAGRRGVTRPRARTIMVRDKQVLRVLGDRALAGEPFEDRGLAALYALPSGTVVQRLALPRARTEPVDRLLALAPQRGLVGPLVRVGDDEGRIAWVDPADGGVARLLLTGLAQARRDPERLVIEPSIRARALLEGRPAR